MVWLSGGPGCSSQLALLAENGPCVPNEDGSDTISNKWSWTNKANVIWVRNSNFWAQIFIFQRFGICIYAGFIFDFRLINPQELDSQVVSMSTMKMVSKKIFMDFWRNFTNSYHSTRTILCISQVKIWNYIPILIQIQQLIANLQIWIFTKKLTNLDKFYKSCLFIS